MNWLPLLAAGWVALAQAGDPLASDEAASWLQRMADASRRLSYEGEFYFQHGDVSQTLRVVNNSAAGNKLSLLTFMDGKPRELRCEHGSSVSITADGRATRMVKRISSRHFPDLLPPEAANLGDWYTVKLGEIDRVANLWCQEVQLQPRDQYRWGYVLCAEKNSALPLRVVMVNEAGRPLLKYAFSKVRIGKVAPIQGLPKGVMESPDSPMEDGQAPVVARQLPPGYAQVAAMKRKLPNRPQEVEHLVFSDGLAYISLFAEQTTQPVESVKGESHKGMINLVTRQVGNWRVTVLGDAPWSAVETVAMGLAPSKP
ncbi:MAG TPA: MucB/RseB C-terminal domain-containing protein [Thiobacillaceae bacterium]|nr:MucB/RseB C-terminal domain-containing protein [Thiobacillaceae bacterium]